MKTLLASTNRAGTTYGRGPAGSHRVFVADGAWDVLNDLQKRSVVTLVWGGVAKGTFRVVDTEEMEELGTFTL